MDNDTWITVPVQVAHMRQVDNTLEVNVRKLNPMEVVVEYDRGIPEDYEQAG